MRLSPILLFAFVATLSGCAYQDPYEACAGLRGSGAELQNRAVPHAYIVCMAEGGNPHAQYLLARRLETGEGVSKDEAQAVRWYTRAAKMRPGADTTYSTPVVEQPHGAILKPEGQNAQPGLAEAQFALGRMYALGRGVKRDDKTARKWFARAAEQGHGGAREWLQRLDSANF